MELRICEGDGDQYGVEVYADGEAVHIYRDLTADRARLSRFCDICNRSCVSRIHIDELIDDFIG